MHLPLFGYESCFSQPWDYKSWAASLPLAWQMRDMYIERTIGRISCFCLPHSYWSMGSDDPSWICTGRIHCSDVPSPVSNACHTSCSIWLSPLATAQVALSS
jgi:hypothetical protein